MKTGVSVSPMSGRMQKSEETIPVRAARGKNIRSAAGETNEF